MWFILKVEKMKEDTFSPASEASPTKRGLHMEQFCASWKLHTHTMEDICVFGLSSDDLTVIKQQRAKL